MGFKTVKGSSINRSPSSEQRLPNHSILDEGGSPNWLTLVPREESRLLLRNSGQARGVSLRKGQDPTKRGGSRQGQASIQWELPDSITLVIRTFLVAPPGCSCYENEGCGTYPPQDPKIKSKQ